MNGRIALDTNIAVAILNGNALFMRKAQEFELIYLPIPVAAELIFGAMNSRNYEKNLRQYRSFINKTHLIHCDYPVSEKYAEIRLQLQRQGTPIPGNDIWVAACCMVQEVPLATRDAHFEKISGIEMKKW